MDKRYCEAMLPAGKDDSVVHVGEGLHRSDGTRCLLQCKKQIPEQNSLPPLCEAMQRLVRL